MIIRPIKLDDNKSIAKVIRTVLIEHNVPKVGTAYADLALDCMYETYDVPRSKYFVITKDGQILGGAGIAPLEGGDANVCELQKMYFLPSLRGMGLGGQLMQICLQFAKEQGFKQCYLETMPYMESAQRLYQRYGFQYINSPLGNTGHVSCPIWMLKIIE